VRRISRPFIQPKLWSKNAPERSPRRTGASAQFARFARGEPWIDQALAEFLGRAYELKSLADYGTGTEASISFPTAKAAIETATRFVDCIARALAV
jgi:hypothetical protein